MNKSLPKVELRLAELKQSGAHAVASIKAIREEFQLSLGEAKLQFAHSPTWTSEQAAAEQFHQQIADASLAEDAN